MNAAAASSNKGKGKGRSKDTSKNTRHHQPMPLVNRIVLWRVECGTQCPMSLILEWTLNGVTLPVYVGKLGYQTWLPVLDAMQLIYEGNTSKKDVRQIMKNYTFAAEGTL